MSETYKKPFKFNMKKINSSKTEWTEKQMQMAKTLEKNVQVH